MTDTAAEPRIAYDREVRFGIVMYGGVSLAIYINGVANELFELACATPKVEGDAPAPDGTRAVYARLSRLLRNPALREKYRAHLENPALPDPLKQPPDADGGERVRFVIDVIAGTSAGGINGVFLAKALANGQPFAALKTMWVQEGDIDLLLNDDASYAGIAFAKTGEPPQSLLNSDRMYLKLLDAMETMERMPPAAAPIGSGESALSDELDLYVTTTDIRGAVVPLRLFDKVVYEKRHKQVYHFQYGAGGGKALGNDFANANTSFLAFAARCTSSFPFAFEPMQVTDALRLLARRVDTEAPDLARWRSFFAGLSPQDMRSDGWTQRAFGDGGYLDNKPFSYVVNALSWRMATVPMERKLIYIEPAPAHPELDRQAGLRKPNALANASDALTSIPQYETIREDLQAVLERNRRIERVERIVRKVETDVDMVDEEPFARVIQEKGRVPDWSELDLGRMIGYYGAAFLPYWRLRMTTVTDDVADRLADHWRVDRQSDRLYAMRALVRAWREEHYYEHQKTKTPTQTRSINAFVNDFDIQYRLRRAAFLLRKTHHLVGVVSQLAMHPSARAVPTDAEAALQARLLKQMPSLATDAQRAPAQAALTQLRSGLWQAFSDLRAKAWPSDAALGPRVSDEDSELLGRLLGLIIGEKLAEPLQTLPGTDGRPVRVLTAALPLPSPLRTLQENVFARTQRLFEAARLGHRTQLQDQLEGHILALSASFASFFREGSTDDKLRVRDLLGNPTLDVRTEPTEQMADRQVVVATVGDVALPQFAAALNTPAGRLLRSFLGEYYLRFDEYDQISFPLYYDTGTGEPSTVEVVRVSPEDAPSLIDEKPGEARKKLAGTALFNFGGFLDAQWRRNDIMWGRLDGCERLLATLLPDDDLLRNALLMQAQRAILQEEMSPAGYDRLVQLFAAALDAENQPTLKAAFENLWPQFGDDDAQRHTRLTLALKAVFEGDELIAYVKKHYEVRRQLDTEKSLKTASRAITITGRILEQIEKEQSGSASRLVWVTRAGRAFQALLAVSTPGSILDKLRSHGLFMLYAVEVLVFAGALVFGSVDSRNFALTAFGVTLALHLATLFTGDLLQRAGNDPGQTLWQKLAWWLGGDVSKPRVVWLRRAAVAAVVVVLALAGLGLAGAMISGKAMLCGKPSPDAPRLGARGWFCGD